jgi:hypothetical protein
MRLFVLFASQPNNPPKAVVVVDQPTIARSGHSEMDYKKLALEQAKESLEDAHTITSWAWFIIDLGPVATGRIMEYLTDTAPHFSTENVTASAISTPHPSTESITVTIGRVPGKIIDDEIRG